MVRNNRKWEAALDREFQEVEKQERKQERSALQAKNTQWRTDLERKIPKSVYTGLESAFCKGFSLVFNQGRAVIEKTYNKEDLQADHAIRDFAVQLKGGRKELKQMRRSASRSDLQNLVVTSAEGIGLGLLGVGIPDIVLFISTLLKGIYETALNYGFDYVSRQEQMLILKMMETALTSGEEWVRCNRDVDAMLTDAVISVADEEFEAQLLKTSAVFSVDMLLLKFIQGIPVVGVLGGAANPFYYGKVMRYVQLKYRKRYLQKQKANPPEPFV